MLCPACRKATAAWLDERIRLHRAVVAAHRGVPGAEHALETAGIFLEAYQEVRAALLGARLPGEDASCDRRR